MPAPAATYQLPGDRLGTQSSRHRPPSPHLAPRPCPAALRRVSAAPPRASPGRANTETLNTGGRATTCPRRDAKPRPSPSGLRGPPLLRCPLALLRVRDASRSLPPTCARLSPSCAKRGAVWGAPLTPRRRSGPPCRRSRERSCSRGGRGRWRWVPRAGRRGSRSLRTGHSELGTRGDSTSSQVSGRLLLSGGMSPRKGQGSWRGTRLPLSRILTLRV